MNDKNRIRKPTDKLVSECFKEYRLKLFRYCLARLDGSREDADDCVQDAFLVFQKTLAEGKTVENPRAFLYRTAENQQNEMFLLNFPKTPQRLNMIICGRLMKRIMICLRKN